MKTLFKLLNSHDIVICDFATKIEILKLRNIEPISKFKVYTHDEVTSIFLGSSDEQIIFALMKDYDVNYEHAKLIKNNLLFPLVSNLTPKTSRLSTYRNNYLEKGLIMVNPLKEVIFAGKKVLLFSSESESPNIYKLLKSVNAKPMYVPPIFNHDHKVTLYKTALEEVYDVLNNIASLLQSGVSPEYIKIVTTNGNYEDLLRRFAYQFKIVLSSKEIPLSSFDSASTFISSLKASSLSVEEHINEIKDSKDEGLVHVLNVYSSIDFSFIPLNIHKKYFVDRLINTKLAVYETNGIELIRKLPQFSSPSIHYFFVNFAQGSAPLITRNDPYLSNEEREALGLVTDEEKARQDNAELITSLKNIEKVYLTFSDIFGSEKYVISPLVKQLKIEKINASSPHTFFSKAYLNYLTGLRKDDYRHYRLIHEDTLLLHHGNLESHLYMSFDYRFKGINYTPSKVRLSYSSIDDYQDLPFDYFAKYILGIREEGSNSNLDFGVFVHKIFEEGRDLASFEFVYNHYLDTFEFNAKDRFFINNRKEVIAAAYKFYHDYVAVVKPSKTLREYPIEIKLSQDLELKGVLDRVLLFEHAGKKTAVIIDFKSGRVNSRPKYYEQGLELQLPIYGLLFSLNDEFKEYEPGALVINSLKPEPYTLGDSTKLQELLKTLLKFYGIILDDTAILDIIDSDRTDSTYFSGLKTIKSGDQRGVTDKTKYKEYVDVAHAKVFETYEAIKRSYFPVSTKKIGSFISGQYSEYKEISYIPSYSQVLEDENEQED